MWTFWKLSFIIKFDFFENLISFDFIQIQKNDWLEQATTLSNKLEHKYSKRRILLNKIYSESNDKPGELNDLNKIANLIKKKMDYNHNGLIMKSVDNSTIILLAKIQANEKKRSLEHDRQYRRSLFRKELSLNNLNNKPTRSVIEEYFKTHMLRRTIRKNRQIVTNFAPSTNTKTVIIDQPNQSTAKITFNFYENQIKNLPMKYLDMTNQYSNRQARLLEDRSQTELNNLINQKSQTVILDHLVLAKSIVLKKS